MKRGYNTRLGAALALCAALGFWCVVGFALAAVYEWLTS